MTPSDINTEISYRTEERLALLGFLSGPDTPRFILTRVRREVLEDVKTMWPDEYAKAVEIGLVTA